MAMPGTLAQRRPEALVSSVVTDSRRLPAAAALTLLVLTSCAEDGPQRGNQFLPLEGDSADSGPLDGGTQNDDAAAEGAEEDILEPAAGFEEIAQRLEALPGEVEALVLEDEQALLQLGRQEAAPLASVAKLYVLAALVDAVDSGEVGWQDTMTLAEEHRSLPAGTLQDQAEGYTTSVHDVAIRTISISDNTGTDMLLDLLGRARVEQAAADYGHHEPQLLQPFLSTREMFQLRWGYPELGAGWEQLQEAERREVLEEVAERPLELDPLDPTGEDLDFGIDWYASAQDIAQLHQALAAREQDHPELRAVLTTSPGLPEPVEDPWWDWLSFKGGGLPGVATATWHAMGPEGAERTVVLLLRTEDTENIAEHRAELRSLGLDALITGTDTQRQENEDSG
ncbi:hypothetical protein GCM10011359_00090 [Nesterenkonia alkaliphila]|nr:hypothetical protein GCM10011359_00090 [Nesterenkonia alkaliphila]